MKRLDLHVGFTIENPAVTVPWGLSKRKLRRLLGPLGLRKVSEDYYVISCVSLSGLSHELAFHFDVSCRRAKYWLDFFQQNRRDISDSYNAFQRHLEQTFGTPSGSDNGEDGFPCHRWDIESFTVAHGVYERHSLCEYVTISPRRYAPSMAAEVFWYIKLPFVLMLDRSLLWQLRWLLVGIIIATWGLYNDEAGQSRIEYLVVGIIIVTLLLYHRLRR